MRPESAWKDKPMDQNVRECIDNLGSPDDTVRLEALQTVLRLTEDEVDWVYDVWDGLVEKLNSENSYQRSIGIMTLCNLAKSDRENRLRDVLERLLAHTTDEKFITTRQCLQNIWKVAATGGSVREEVLGHLEKRFRGCAAEKHYNLIRQDIIQSMRCLYEEERDDALLAKARMLASEEPLEKYRKKLIALLQAK